MSKTARKLATTDFAIAVDTREQLPYGFTGLERRGRIIIPRVVRQTLATGDYSIVGHESEICIERKSATDLFGVVGRDRERFERELERMSNFRYAAIVVESEYSQLLDFPPSRSKVTPVAVIHSLWSWSIRYGVHVYAVQNRRVAEQFVFFSLCSYWSSTRKKPS